MTAPHIQAMLDEHGWPHHVVKVWVDNEAWVQDNGCPGFVGWSVHAVEGWTEPDRTPLFLLPKASNSSENTSNIDEAAWVARGSVKWDGCTNWQTDEDCMLHACGSTELRQFLDAVHHAYELAALTLGERAS